MSGHNEWELLMISEDIEQGDGVYVEHEDGHVEELVYVKALGKSVIMKGSDGTPRHYSAFTLEEVPVTEDDECLTSFIVGKA